MKDRTAKPLTAYSRKSDTGLGPVFGLGPSIWFWKRGICCGWFSISGSFKLCELLDVNMKMVTMEQLGQ